MTQSIMIHAAEHPIKSVTVFKSSRAEVVRTFNLDLKAGKNEIDIDGLPSCMDPDSARVTGLGDARLSDFTCIIGKASTPTALQRHIEKLRGEKEALDDEKYMRERQVGFLVNYGDTLAAEHVQPEQALAFADAYLKQRLRDMDALKALEGRISELDKELTQERERQGKRKGSADGQAHVVVATTEDGPVQLKLTYIVTRTQWTSAYDLHAQTDEDGRPTGSVSFKYRARVAQATGEDWTDTTLVLSTSTSDALARGIPNARSLHVTPLVRRPPPPPPPAPLAPAASMAAIMTTRRGVQSRMKSLRSGDSDSEGDEDILDLGTALPEMMQTTTKVGESAVSMTFTVEGKSSVPTDGVAHQLSIATLTLDATTSHVAVPRVETAAYLLCSVKNTSDYRLLPGIVSVYLDDSFVSKTSIQHVDAGDVFDCTFGPDAALPITYTQTENVTQGKGGAFTEKHNSTVYGVRVTLVNKHRFPIKNVVVRESIPVASPDFDERAKVILQKPMELAEAKQGDEVGLEGGVKARWSIKDGAQEGRYEWTCDVDAGKEVVLEAQYEIRAPADIAWNLSG